MTPEAILGNVGGPLQIPEIVTFPPDVDALTSEQVGQALLTAIRPGVAVVIADLSRTDFCDVAGIRSLVIASNHAVCTGSELRVVARSAAVLRAMRVVEADQMLRIYPHLEAALTGAPDRFPRP
jgi:anti-anti-sigma factor